MTFAFGARADGFAAWTAAVMLVLTIPHITAAQEPPKNFLTHGAAKPVVAITFEDAQGRSRSLADLEGKTVLLNIWATWCVPCRLEMPALDRLQASLGGPDFEVVPVSIDRGGMTVVRKFYDEIGIRNLGMYVDASGQAVRQVGAVGLPTTLLIDRAGREVGRIIGPAAWDSPEIAEFLKPIIAGQDAPAKRADRDDQSEPPQIDFDEAGPIARSFRRLRAFFNR
jgi:thiol-disulfide isomerase/thioredoxin